MFGRRPSLSRRQAAALELDDDGGGVAGRLPICMQPKPKAPIALPSIDAAKCRCTPPNPAPKQTASSYQQPRIARRSPEARPRRLFGTRRARFETSSSFPCLPLPSRLNFGASILAAETLSRLTTMPPAPIPTGPRRQQERSTSVPPLKQPSCSSVCVDEEGGSACGGRRGAEGSGPQEPKRCVCVWSTHASRCNRCITVCPSKGCRPLASGAPL